MPARTLRRVIDGDRSLSWELAAALVMRGYTTADWLLYGLQQPPRHSGFCGVPVRSIYPVLDSAAVPPTRQVLPAAVPTKPALALPAISDQTIAQPIYDAQIKQKPVILFVDGYFIQHGAASAAQALLHQGYISAVAFDETAALADLAHARLRDPTAGLQVATSIAETAFLAASTGCGLGEAIGRSWWVKNDDTSLSLLATAYGLNLPVTIHPAAAGFATSGPATNFAGQALGAAAYVDFLVFAAQVQRADGGVFINAAQTTDFGWRLFSAARTMAEELLSAPISCVTIDCVPVLLQASDMRCGQSVAHHIVGEIASTFVGLQHACKLIYGGKKSS